MNFNFIFLVYKLTLNILTIKKRFNNDEMLKQTIKVACLKTSFIDYFYH
jgi:hypothetical protein